MLWASSLFAWLLVAIFAGGQTQTVTAEFATASEAAKVRVLGEIASSASTTDIEDVIAVVRLGMRDGSPKVRTTALAAVMGRAVASRWAGTSGLDAGAGRPGNPAPPRTIPAEWKGDQQRLREAVGEDCIALLKSEPDDEVRHYALLAVLNLEARSRPQDPLRDPIVALLLDLYPRDPSTRIRTEVLKTFGLISNESAEIRAVLRDALVDANPSIRAEALASITPQATGGPPRVPFEEARDTLTTALANADPAVRLGAVQALNVFGAAAAQQVPALERLVISDPDAKVRESARLAIEAIRRALQKDFEQCR